MHVHAYIHVLVYHIMYFSVVLDWIPSSW